MLHFASELRVGAAVTEVGLPTRLRVVCIWVWAYAAFLTYAAHSSGASLARILAVASETVPYVRAQPFSAGFELGEDPLNRIKSGAYLGRKRRARACGSDCLRTAFSL